MDVDTYTNYALFLEHDFASVLTDIYVFTSVAERRKKPEEIQQCLEKIRDTVRRGYRLLFRAKFITQGIEAIDLQFRPHTPRSILDCLHRTVSDHERRDDHNHRDIRLHDDLRNPRLTYLADLAKLEEVFTSLLENAIQFSDSYMDIIVDIYQKSNGMLVIDVKNWGNAPAGDFSQWAKRGRPGYGAEMLKGRFGLAIASEIAKLHHAELVGKVTDRLISVSFILPAA